MKIPPIPQHLRKNSIRISAIVFGIVFLHLIGVYIYAGGSYIGVPGGSVSVGMIGKAPDILSPLSYGSNPYDKALFRFVFRGLIRYNPEAEIASSDLARCDLSTLEKVTCTLIKDQKWSDGTPIENRDVLATFQALEENASDPQIKTFLEQTSITAKGENIIFSRKTKDPIILSVLTYPIFRSDIIEQAKSNRISSGSYVTSGQYMFANTSEESEYRSTKISLVANPNYSGKSSWLERISFRFFESDADIEKSEDTLGIIVPRPKNEKLTLSARWKTYEYTSYEFFSVFFNTDTLPKNLRNSLHWQIGTSFSGKIDPAHKKMDNIFARKDDTLPTGALGNFADIMRKSGYIKKDELIAKIDSTPTTFSGSVAYDAPKFFQNKQNSNVFFIDDAKGGILLRGKVPSNITEVLINGYALKEFLPNNQEFSYRVSLENGTLKEGKNTYLLEGTGLENPVSEIFTIYYSPDENILTGYQNEVDKEYIARQNTPALIAEREASKKELREKALLLDERYYYNEKNEPFTIKVAYANGVQSTESYVKNIEEILKNLSLKTELINLETKQIDQIIQTGKRPYDILVIGVEAGTTVSDIGKVFRVGKGVNFANIESKTLESLFEDLRVATDEKSIYEIESKILDIMRQESFFLPLSSPIHRFYIDRNLKGIRQIPMISGKDDLYDVMEHMSIKDTYILNLEGKGLFKFIGWLFGQL